MAARRNLRGLLSTADVGAVNRGRLLQSLIDDGPASRAELGRRVNVPRASIGVIVSGLLADGILQEDEPVPPADGIGKPARPLWFTRTALLSGAVAVSRCCVEIAVVAAGGDVLARRAVAVDTDRGPDRLDQEVLRAAADVLGPFRDRLCGIGLSAPALCSPTEREVVACLPAPGLVGTRLPELLEQLFGVPTLLEQDVRAIALGEKWFGLGRGRRDFAALQFDVGVGGGIMLDGHLWGAHARYTMQLGHTCVDVDGDRCKCGLTGCWETVASLRWLRRAAAVAGIPGGRTTSPARLHRRAAAGDAAAAAVLDRYGDQLAIGIGNLVQLLSLDLFVLHGAVVGAGPDFLAALRAKVLARVMPELATGVELVYSRLDQDSVLLGAAAVVLTRYLGAAA
ncbi:ROK family protein [Nakamurella endophytica]|uniref:ROK family transcriptional regulator n=1 Tax=Nakamurella endophytica TaxID=1748367 RepID=A0A917SX61_9ACTN|nr:ROK family protein [Nakamurella endophytica]GGL99288.1 hypothetical protein GCM10011594_19090 [Nakamurella endophytica]